MFIVSFAFRFPPDSQSCSYEFISSVMSSAWRLSKLSPPGLLLSDVILDIYSAFSRWEYISFTVENAAYVVDSSLSAQW
jgi:hypothetical protein